MNTSRRSFLAGAAATGLAGFITDSMAATTPAKLAIPTQWDMTADVVVAGSGIAGMCAATAAVDNGAGKRDGTTPPRHNACPYGKYP